MNALDLQPLNIFAPGPDLIILLVLAVLLFGGTRLAGIGKGAGRAIREFKEETDGMRNHQQVGTGATAVQPGTTQPVVGQPVTAQPVVPQQVPSMDQQAAADQLPHQQHNL